MTKLQSIALGMVMVALSVSALFQIIHVGHVLRLASIGVAGAVSIVASVIFFAFAFAKTE